MGWKNLPGNRPRKQHLGTADRNSAKKPAAGSITKTTDGYGVEKSAGKSAGKIGPESSIWGRLTGTAQKNQQPEATQRSNIQK